MPGLKGHHGRNSLLQDLLEDALVVIGDHWLVSQKGWAAQK